MKEITRLATEINRIAENSNPSIYDLSKDMLYLIKNKKFYSSDEVMEMLDRRDSK